VSAPNLDALYAEAELEAVDGMVQRRFGLQPVEDVSGMFTGRSSLAPAPTPANVGNEPTTPTTPTIHQGPRGAAADDDAAMADAYVRRYFPGSVG
jgi:hypothetical protein